MSGRGRPTKYTPELAKAICDAAREGCTPKTAAEINGIDDATLNRWLDRYSDFCTAFRLARAQARHAAVRVIRTEIQAGNVDAAWKFLGKMEPEVYGDKQKHEVTGADGAPLVIQFAQRTDGPQ